MQKYVPGKDEPDSLPRRVVAGVDPLAQYYQMFGLGRAVDASEPSPLKSITHQQDVRSIFPNLVTGNIMEKSAKERSSYEEAISSLKTHRTSVTASVSDIVGKVVTLQAEAEYKRQNSKEMHISGKLETLDSLSL